MTIPAQHDVILTKETAAQLTQGNSFWVVLVYEPPPSTLQLGACRLCSVAPSEYCAIDSYSKL